jgi:hypothetical protein
MTVSIDLDLQLPLLAPTSCSSCSLTSRTVTHGKSSSSRKGKGEEALYIYLLSHQRSNGNRSGVNNSSLTDIQPHVPSRVCVKISVHRSWTVLYEETSLETQAKERTIPHIVRSVAEVLVDGYRQIIARVLTLSGTLDNRYCGGHSLVAVLE